MNDIVLSSLLNLFAIFGSDNGLDREKSLLLISDYLRTNFGVKDLQSYINLYTTLRDYYDDVPDLDKDSIAEGICGKLKGSLDKTGQGAMVLRLLEFCSTNEDKYNPNYPIFRKVADVFGISDDRYSNYVNFVAGREDDCVKVIDLGKGQGKLKTLYQREENILYFTYCGRSDIRMNDRPVMSGSFQQWLQSGVLKGKNIQPYYYSTIVSLYDNEQSGTFVEFCGRGVDFRFDESSDVGMHNLSFSLHSGQLIAIMGGSGVGKSTLLSLLNGSLRPQKGFITINGHDITEPAAKALIGFVPQDDLLIEELTVYENLWYTAKLCFDNMPEEEIDRRVLRMLKQLGLDAAKDLKVGSPINKYISGGQRKRLNIALELIREPAVLFLDEPTSGLSSSDTEKVINLLKEQTGKGKLIIVNIHQPSSDVYKLFDRLWLLDKGGYPVYDGNPIEAVSYFKSAANYADADISACPTCGNVNPEVILNIIDERALDATGQMTDKRRIQPGEWHEMYLKNRPEMEPAKVSDVPPTDQRRPSALRQFLIFLRRNCSTKLTNLQYILVTLMEAPLLAAISAVLTRYVPESGVYCLMENKNFTSYLFMAIIVAIFLGMSGSAEEIIKDRALLKREKFLNLSYAGYIWSKIIYMAGVCLIQTLLFIVVGNLITGVHGLFWEWWMILFISAFLASLTGLLLSQCLNSVVAIYITIPLLLIPQILLCGLVVDFDDLNSGSETGNVPVIGDVIPSRWAYEALAVTSFSKNDFEKQFYEADRDKYTCMYYSEAFLYELESQVETRYDEMFRQEEGKEDPRHLKIIHTEFEHLARICGIEDYAGDDSYESLSEYIGNAKKILKERGNRTTLAMDRQVNAFIAENGSEKMLSVKRGSHNLQLENLVLNRKAEKLYVVRGSHIVPRCGYVFLTPRSHNGRAPFYSGVKVLGWYEIETLWFNMAVLLCMCVVLTIFLLKDFPGKFVRQERN